MKKQESFDELRPLFPEADMKTDLTFKASVDLGGYDTN
jgi:hypothetical protein